jgi:bifunctional NMN adenylyltransferase/nudix hydrolase
MFPQWEFIPVDPVDILDATSIRSLYFSDKCNFDWFNGVLPRPVINFMKNFKYPSGHEIMGVPLYTNVYNKIIDEREFIETYRKQYEHLPYAPVFVTVDAVVFQQGHVLMVKRRSEPGKGLLAFPGGFLNAKEDRSVKDAMVRELKEETGIKVPDKVILGSIEESKVFDAIDRSARGRTITHAFKVSLSGDELPKVKGADDAEKAMWIPISKINRSECFEDHYDILMHFLGR